MKSKKLSPGRNGRRAARQIGDEHSSECPGVDPVRSELDGAMADVVVCDCLAVEMQKCRIKDVAMYVSK
jgi:hypothetical protein